jgi:hypothetical protein
MLGIINIKRLNTMIRKQKQSSIIIIAFFYASTGYDSQIPGHARYSMISNAHKGDYNLRIYNITVADEGVYECQVSPARGHQALRSAAIIGVAKDAGAVAVYGAAAGSKTSRYTSTSTDILLYHTTTTDQAVPEPTSTVSSESVQPLGLSLSTDLTEQTVTDTEQTVTDEHPSEPITTEKDSSVSGALQPVLSPSSTDAKGLLYKLSEPTTQYPSLSSASVFQTSLVLMNGCFCIFKLLQRVLIED